MKHILSILFLLITLSAFSQDKFKQRHEELKALKVSYITERLDLSTKEAEKFWPTYNVYQLKLHDMRNELRGMVKANKETPIDNQLAYNLITKHVKAEEIKAVLLKALVSDLKPVLSSEKIWKLMRAEKGFRRKLIKQYKQRQHIVEKN